MGRGVPKWYDERPAQPGNNARANFRGFFLAGAVGIEPTSEVLETSVLPLNDAPSFVRALYTK